MMEMFFHPAELAPVAPADDDAAAELYERYVDFLAEMVRAGAISQERYDREEAAAWALRPPL